MEIFELSNKLDKLDETVDYFWKCWGNDSNLNFYTDCIHHSLDKKNALPKFYIAIKLNQIIGSYALLSNDLISRQDLMPWLACLHVNKDYRKRGYAEALLQHGITEARIKGFNNLYLSTDLINYYERKGWTKLGKGYGFSGEEINIYERSTKK